MHVCMQIHVQTVIDLHLQSTSPAEYQLEKSVRESERKRKGERERERKRETEGERERQMHWFCCGCIFVPCVFEGEQT